MAINPDRIAPLSIRFQRFQRFQRLPLHSSGRGFLIDQHNRRYSWHRGSMSVRVWLYLRWKRIDFTAFTPLLDYWSVLTLVIRRAGGEDNEMPVVPNTPEGACQPSREPRVIIMATPPFTVLRCNESWTKVCGYSEVRSCYT